MADVSGMWLDRKSLRPERHLAGSRRTWKPSFSWLISIFSRVTVARIENRMRSVYDYEMQIIASVLRVSPEQLLPPAGKTAEELDELKSGYR
jgi:hypothetical protein